jgi:hypothetical protein
MKRDFVLAVMIAAGITATSVSAHPWSRVVQNEADLCRTIEGGYVPYSVNRKNGQGDNVTLMFHPAAQSRLCPMVKKFPR